MNVKAAIAKLDSMQNETLAKYRSVYGIIHEVLLALGEPSDRTIANNEDVYALEQRIARLEGKVYDLPNNVALGETVKECEHNWCGHGDNWICKKCKTIWIKPPSPIPSHPKTDGMWSKPVVECEHNYISKEIKTIGASIYGYECSKCKTVSIDPSEDAKPSECKAEPFPDDIDEVVKCQQCAKKQDRIHALNDKLSMLTEEADMIMIDRKVAEEWLHRHDGADLNGESNRMAIELRHALTEKESK
jgi:hypothetical protein